MKNKIIVSLLAVAMVLITFGTLAVGCNNTAPTEEYTVTVLSPSEEPIKGVTVNWNAGGSVKGSAISGEDGKATAKLPSGTYSITLSNLEDGLTYTEVSVSASMRKIIIQLERERITYTATVKTKTGSPAANVTVSWRKGNAAAGTAKTNAQGVASVELEYGEYSVFVSDLPAGNIFEGSVKADGKNPDTQINLFDGETLAYTLTVKTEGGLLFADAEISIYNGDNLVLFGNTDKDGVYAFTLAKREYKIVMDNVPNGYTTKYATVSPEQPNAIMTLKSSVIMTDPAPDTEYVIGDIIHNYTFTTPYTVNGMPVSVSIAELLKTKKAILINNWGTQCSWCLKEMPAMQEAYEKYKDVIEIVAISNYQGGDSDSTITAFYEQYGYTFPMMRDKHNIAGKFQLSAYPTTIVIDRYGAIARVESGAILDAEVWERLFEKYIGDDYVQTFIPGTHTSDSITSEISKPDITVDADHYEKVGEFLNNSEQFPAGASVEYYGETEYEYAWPYIYGAVEGVSDTENVLYASNTGKPNSIAIIYAKVNVAPGKVFTFDYWAQTELDSDIMSIVWDGKVVRTISGDSEGWKTCYVYTDLTAEEHSFAMTYIKDSSTNTGKDNIYIKNVRFLDVADVTEPTDMIRSAAYGRPDEGADRYPYYADIELKSDGYYHVNTSALENSEFAGNDEAPLVFVNLLNASNWNSYSLRELILGVNEAGEYVINCNFTVNGVYKDWREDLTEYLYTATISEIYGFLPLDAELHDILVQFMKSASGFSSHEKEVLEVCYFYSHYGSGTPIGNPIIGLTTETAIPVEAETTITADLTRYFYPYPIKTYSFTAPADGVYKIESLIPAKDALQYGGQIWLYDDSTDDDNPLISCGDTRITIDGVNEHNFEIHRYMKAGERYYFTVSFRMAEVGKLDFKITCLGETATTLLPCSDDFYTAELDENGAIIGGTMILAGAVQTIKDANGYYHAVKPDGTMGDFIYLDVLNPTPVMGGRQSLSQLADAYLPDPIDKTGKTKLDYKVFDFRYRVTYYHDEADKTIVRYEPKHYLGYLNPEGKELYKDYTARVKELVASAPAEGELKGLIKVTDEIVTILKLYIETRNNMAMDGVYEPVLDNEWLRFCWYFRTYDAKNV